MGGYVLRSINAHFKLWDEGVQDSFGEYLNQSNTIPVINASCQCSQVNGTCGCNTAGCPCPSNEREVDTMCNPQSCNGGPGTTCILDPSCCGAPVPVGCGTVPLNFLPAPPAAPNTANCYFGYQIYQAQCGNQVSVTCVQDPNCPLPQCTGTVLYPGSTVLCPGATVGLARDMPYIYDGDGAASCGTNPPPCQVYCVAPYFLNAAHTQCVQAFTVAALLPQVNASAQSCNAPTNFPPSGCSPSCTSDSSANCTNCSCSATQNPGACGCVHGCNKISRSEGGFCWVTHNTENFVICLGAGTNITGTTLQAIPPPVPQPTGSGYSWPPVSNGGCSQPQGEPNQKCSILVTTS